MQTRQNRFGMLDDPGNIADIWRYGWRYVADPAKPDELLKQPLTLEDILHPLEEDIWLSNELHVQDLAHSKYVAWSRLKDDLTALVLSDIRIAWDEDGLYAHRPDLAVFRGVSKPRQNWTTFNVVREGCRPMLLLEVTSPSTRMLDLVNKVEEYEDEGVLMYVIADGGRTWAREHPVLLVYRHNGIRLARQPLAANGRVWLDVLGVSLGWEGDRLAYYLPDGQRFPEVEELDRRNVDLTDRVTFLSDQVETTEKERDDARGEAARLAERIRQLEAMLNPPPPDAA